MNPTEVIDFYFLQTDVIKNKSVITLSTLNSNRIDKIQSTIYNLYSLNGEVIGEQASNYSTIDSLNAKNISYRIITSDTNIFDKVIILGSVSGAIFDEKIPGFIFSEGTFSTTDYLGNKVEITKLPNDLNNLNKVIYRLVKYNK